MPFTGLFISSLNDYSTCCDRAAEHVSTVFCIAKFSLPPSLLTIARFAFAQCSTLPVVAVPASVRSIGVHAFINCSPLAPVAIASRDIDIDRFAFD